MMSGAKKMAPKRRFKEFLNAGDWELRKFSEITYLSGIKNKENKPYESYSISNEFGFIPQNEQFEHGGTMKTADKSMYYIVTQNSFAYNPARINVGSIGYYDKPDNVIVSSLYEVFKTTEIVNDKFLWHWFKSNQFNHLIEKYQEGGVRLYFYYDKLCKGAIELPTIDEQNKISNLLNGLDLFITLHQRKLDKLQATKKALLQEMFPEEGQDKPKRRFKGFTDAWEQRKLGQFTARVTRKNGGQSDLPLTISAQDGLVDQRKYFNRQVASRDMSNYYLIKKGEFAYNKSYSEGYPFGAVKRLDYYDIGALSTLYILFEITDKNISSDFIVSYYMTHLWYKEISKRAAEGARNHGLLNISTDDFFDSELNIPNSIDEQVKIGNFIKEFDKFITLHQQEPFLCGNSVNGGVELC